MSMTSWKELLESAFEGTGDTWDDVEGSTLPLEALNKKFDDSFGLGRRRPFTLWTKHNVYTGPDYDGSDHVIIVDRNPDESSKGIWKGSEA